MPGRNKRLSARYLRDLAWAMVREAAERRDQDDRFYSVQRWHQDGVRGFELDIENVVGAALAQKGYRSATVITCTVSERPDNWSRVFPRIFTGHVTWRGNRFGFEVSSESVLERRRWIVREVGRDAARSLGAMPCRHAGEKQQRHRWPDISRVAFNAVTVATSNMVARVVTVCLDCGEEVSRG
jgi:hypothetical protein